MDKQDKKELKTMGKKKFIQTEKNDIKQAKGYPAPKKGAKKK